MSGADLLEDSFPHGTVQGFRQGCRGSICPASETLSCFQVSVRYRGDWSFQKRVDAGVPVSEIVAADAAAWRESDRVERAQRRAVQAAVLVVVPRVARPKAVKPVQAPVPVVRRVVHGTVEGYWAFDCFTVSCPVSPSCADANLARVQGQALPHPEPHPQRVQRRKVLPHGTNAGFARGCRSRTACPNLTTGGLSCYQANREYHRDYMARRRVQGIPAEKHGTAYGYQLGCASRGACPGGVGGVLCPDAVLVGGRRRRREAGVREQVPLVPVGEVRAHVQALMSAGLSLLCIAERAGVSKSAVKNMLYGRSSGTRAGKKPEWVAAETARRLLALPDAGEVAS